MSAKEHLHAFIATLAALVAIMFGSYLAAYFIPALIGKAEAFGMGAVTMGLINVLISFRPRQPPDSGVQP